MNENRYFLLLGTKEDNYFFMFKREPFYSFGLIFNLGNQAGETINAEHLKVCIKNQVKKIFIAYESGTTYEIMPEDFLNYNLTRDTDNENKKTYSIPISELNRINLVQKKELI